MAKYPVRCIDVLLWTNWGRVKASGVDVYFYRTKDGEFYGNRYIDISGASIERLNMLASNRSYTIRAHLNQTHSRIEVWM